MERQAGTPCCSSGQDLNTAEISFRRFSHIFKSTVLSVEWSLIIFFHGYFRKARSLVLVFRSRKLLFWSLRIDRKQTGNVLEFLRWLRVASSNSSSNGKALLGSFALPCWRRSYALYLKLSKSGDPSEIWGTRKRVRTSEENIAHVLFML